VDEQKIEHQESGTPEEAEETQTEQPRENALSSFIKELPLLIIIAFAVAWIIKSFIVQPFFIPSGSMEPTFIRGDHVLVNKFIYRFTGPKRGDIIVFKYPLDPSKDYIKRIAAFEGETIEIKNNVVHINGKEHRETYSTSPAPISDYGPYKVEKGKIFVLGDNRNNSADSRSWGTLPVNNIIGKSFVVYWPPNRIVLVK